MPRYKNRIVITGSAEKIDRQIARYLSREGFEVINEDDNVWQKGNGWLLWPQFVRFEIRSGKLYLEAWLKFPILPGVYVGEAGIDGLFGMIPKRQLKARVEKIEAIAEPVDRVVLWSMGLKCPEADRIIPKDSHPRTDSGRLHVRSVEMESGAG